MRKHSAFFIVLFLSSLAHLSFGQQSNKDSVRASVLSVEEYSKKIASSKNIQLVDVRTPEEYKEAHLKGFTNIDWQGINFDKEISKLDKSKPTYIHCRSGKRSAAASAAMIKQGFKEVYDLKGGINAWKEAGKPVE